MTGDGKGLEQPEDGDSEGAPGHLSEPAELYRGDVKPRQADGHVAEHLDERWTAPVVGAPARGRGEDRDEDEGGEHVETGKPMLLHEPPRQKGSADGGARDHDGPRVGMTAAGDGEPEAVNDRLVPVASLGHADEVTHLSNRDEQARARHEAQNHRLGDVPSEVAETEHGDHDLKGAGHDR